MTATAQSAAQFWRVVRIPCCVFIECATNGENLLHVYFCNRYASLVGLSKKKKDAPHDAKIFSHIPRVSAAENIVE